MHAILRRKRWKVVSRRLKANWGHCDQQLREIAVSTSVRSEETFLDVLLHEALHACHWDLDEEVIDRTATDLARLLTRLGVKVDVAEAKKRMKS